jgi:hypothetical protein
VPPKVRLPYLYLFDAVVQHAKHQHVSYAPALDYAPVGEPLSFFFSFVLGAIKLFRCPPIALLLRSFVKCLAFIHSIH